MSNITVTTNADGSINEIVTTGLMTVGELKFNMVSFRNMVNDTEEDRKMKRLLSEFIFFIRSKETLQLFGADTFASEQKLRNARHAFRKTSILLLAGTFATELNKEFLDEFIRMFHRMVSTGENVISVITKLCLLDDFLDRMFEFDKSLEEHIDYVPLSHYDNREHELIDTTKFQFAHNGRYVEINFAGLLDFSNECCLGKPQCAHGRCLTVLFAELRHSHSSLMFDNPNFRSEWDGSLFNPMNSTYISE